MWNRLITMQKLATDTTWKSIFFWNSIIQFAIYFSMKNIWHNWDLGVLGSSPWFCWCFAVKVIYLKYNISKHVNVTKILLPLFIWWIKAQGAHLQCVSYTLDIFVFTFPSAKKTNAFHMAPKPIYKAGRVQLPFC